MKLIFLTIILVIYFTLKVESQKLREFQFPSPFQMLRPTMFTSENSHYLPPESQTVIPYFPMKNENKLSFQYLPPTGTKAPSMYPTAYPMMISSSPRRNSYDEDNDENGNDMNKLHLTSAQPQTQVNRSNQTSIQQLNAHVENREMRIVPRTVYNEHPVDRIDIKYPSSERIELTTLHPIQQTPATRRTIIAAETQRNDHIFDLDKSASIIAPQYMHPGFVMSSTTEPAIPILRLSNEMDLDGSFSYEALGADQTHYVQHSRMENAGTDKEEQVVEGSYSYVGDNGQTYTVHYVADSNGFRASGDHLPVAPPIPEIIQRSIQYNLAAEAKKPPHNMKSWNEDNNRQENIASERNQDFTVLPLRNLFTGRTPEAFSYSFTQEDKALNNMVSAASSQAPFKTNIDFAKEQTQIKENIGTIISPQVTFLASQGAHSPSASLVQQSVAKLFTNEKTTMPQLINYDAGLKEPVRENKPLWRWQYGYGNNFDQNSNKNTISRSEGDEVMVNFNDMTPEQYTNMINSQFTIDSTEKNASEDGNSTYNRNFYERDYESDYEVTQNLQNQPQDIKKELSTTPENSLNWLHNNNLYLRPIDTRLSSNKNVEVLRPTDNGNSNHKNYKIPNTPSESYSDNILDNYYGLKKTNLRDKNEIFQTNTGTIKTGDLQNVSSTSKYSEMIYSTSTQIPKTVFNFETQNDKNNDIYSIKIHKITDNNEKTTTTDTSIEDMFDKNIFLKNLFHPTEQQEKKESKAIEETPQHQLKKINAELKPDQFPKPVNKKTLDMSDILNYMTVKNHFESNKIKSKSKPQTNENLNQNNEDIITPIQKSENEERLKYYSEDRNRFRILNPQTSEEIHGNIRNYKVLQRNNHMMSQDQGNSNQFRNYLNQQVNQFKQTQGQPPLGRAGPSMKSYLPPIYV